jgi:hypothetical protein
MLGAHIENEFILRETLIVDQFCHQAPPDLSGIGMKSGPVQPLLIG